MSDEAARAMVLAGICPICMKGAYKCVAGHVSHSHGMDVAALKYWCGFRISDSICDPELASLKSKQAKERGAVPPKRPHGRPVVNNWALVEANRQNSRAGTPEQRHERAVAAGLNSGMAAIKDREAWHAALKRGCDARGKKWLANVRAAAKRRAR